MDFNPMTQIMAVLSSFRKQIEQDENMMLISGWNTLLAAKESNKIGVGFDLEGAIPLLPHLDMVELFAHLGVRQIHLAYNRNNAAAGGCHDDDHGLTKLGLLLVQRIQQSGIILDMSHNGIATSLDICSAATKPVVFSHANARALIDHPRNITDEQILACANTGGVICINGVQRFLGAATPEQFARHCAYVTDLVGIDHVGIGLDTMMDQAGINDMPEQLNTHHWWPPKHYPQGIGTLKYLQPEDLPAIDRALEVIGFQREERDKIYWENMTRVAKTCWNP